MARRAATRRELEQHSFHPAVILLAAGIMLFLGMYLPHIFPKFALLDLPLIIVIYFAISLRSPISGTLIGASTGILQDLATNAPIGILGIAKSIVGYAAASISLRVDVENILSRAILNFGFTLLQSCILFAVNHWMLDLPTYRLLWLHELLRAAVNTVVAIPVSFLLDRMRTESWQRR
ncbi:MAG: rod shape-determining protein MreD [Acidobacteria bacterium]|nr:rod shape-determining protein MreD [Acidobacteriota bacterium]